MDIVKLKPAVKDYIWGGTKLKTEWGKVASFTHIAESWELSCNKNGYSIIDSGHYKGIPLYKMLTKDELGSLGASFRFFPVLIKLIDSDDCLSIQVHPNDEYALKNEKSFGKTEMWYIISNVPHAGIFLGFKRKVCKEEIRQKIKDKSLIDALNFIEVKPGDCFFIEPGTVHSIGKGITLIEIQQNSDLTYRLYDYERLEKDGKPRKLNIKKALEVVNTNQVELKKFNLPLIGKCSYFSSYIYDSKSDKTVKADSDSFATITFLSGSGVFYGIKYGKGDTFFIPANKQGIINGTGKYILTKTEK